MAQKIQFVGTTTARIIDTTPSTVSRLDPDEVARALGAEPTPAKVSITLGPITLYAVRMELFQRLQSHGGDPSREGNNLQPTIPLGDEEWHKLEELAAQIAASTGLSPSPGQVGSVLLSLALRSVTAETNEKGNSAGAAALVNELASRGKP
jgi:hypothetical protein